MQVTGDQRFIDAGSLAAWRIRAGLSQAALARSSGLHPTYIRLLERSDRCGKPESACRIADALGCPVTELLDKEIAGTIARLMGLRAGTSLTARRKSLASDGIRERYDLAVTRAARHLAGRTDGEAVARQLIAEFSTDAKPAGRVA